MEPDHFWGLLYTEIAGFILALLSCALFSFLETSVTALRLFKLKELATSTTRYKKLLETLENNPHQVLITILIANCLANVTAAALITTIMEQIFAKLNLSTGLGFSVGIGFGTFAMLLFGEVIPKNVAKIHGEKLFRSALWITNITFYLLYPFVQLLINVSDLFVSFVGGRTESTELVTSEREIRFLIDYITKKGLIETEKTEMLQSIFNFGSKPVKEIMVPMIDIIMIGTTESLKDALMKFSTYQFSRLPVYEHNPDNVIGMIYQKDIFALLSKG
jgi:putative hemolysin